MHYWLRMDGLESLNYEQLPTIQLQNRLINWFLPAIQNLSQQALISA